MFALYNRRVEAVREWKSVGTASELSVSHVARIESLLRHEMTGLSSARR